MSGVDVSETFVSIRNKIVYNKNLCISMLLKFKNLKFHFRTVFFRKIGTWILDISDVDLGGTSLSSSWRGGGISPESRDMSVCVTVSTGVEVIGSAMGRAFFLEARREECFRIKEFVLVTSVICGAKVYIKDNFRI